jgi:DNA-binding GntR family transcriptional regulator
VREQRNVPRATKKPPDKQRAFPRLEPRQTLTEVVYRRLRDDIISGRCDSDEFLSTGDIAKAMGISPMPVRAALTRLETEGLVVIVPQRGVKVTSVSIVELRELFVIRSRLEALAAGLACPHLTGADFRKLEGYMTDMVKCAHRGDAKRWLASHEQWHHLIFYAGRNEQLTRLLLDVWHRVMFRRIAPPNVPGHMDRVNTDHRAILAALKSRDAALVERLWRDHILAAGKEILAFLEQARVQPKRLPGQGEREEPDRRRKR